MGGPAKPPRGEAEAKRSPSAPSRKKAAPTVREPETGLAEALEQFQTRNRDLVEAPEQQTPTSEILQVISSSPTGVEPVFEAKALDLCRQRPVGSIRSTGSSSTSPRPTVAPQMPVPIGIGERLHTIYEFRELLEGGGSRTCARISASPAGSPT
jgi:hypothetical protein